MARGRISASDAISDLTPKLSRQPIAAPTCHSPATVLNRTGSDMATLFHNKRLIYPHSL